MKDDDDEIEIATRVPRRVEPRAPEAPAAELRTVLEWGTVKGHNPKPGPVGRGKQHKGPHVFVVLTHLGGGNAKAWPGNKLVSASEYDDAVRAAYGITVR